MQFGDDRFWDFSESGVEFHTFPLICASHAVIKQEAQLPQRYSANGGHTPFKVIQDH